MDGKLKGMKDDLHKDDIQNVSSSNLFSGVKDPSYSLSHCLSCIRYLFLSLFLLFILLSFPLSTFLLLSLYFSSSSHHNLIHLFPLSPCIFHCTS